MTTKRGCPSHPQSTQLKPPGAPYRCSGCQEVGFGRSYHCGNNNCSYILHEECANAVSFAFHSFFPKSDFELYEKALGHRVRYCDACGKDVLGFVYHCSRTGYDLHPCCLKMKDRISDEEGRVTLELSQKVPSKCVKCKHKNVVDGVKGWSYVSSGSGGNYCYHVSCVKELIFENLKRGYFSQETNSIGMSDREYSQLALRSMEMVQRGGRSGTIKKYTKNGL
ncbi:protein-disulfide reductase [Spatholobus suberectus]|nr:protein-disulfide reductase [Spatholobus suberectus]